MRISAPVRPLNLFDIVLVVVSMLLVIVALFMFGMAIALSINHNIDPKIAVSKAWQASLVICIITQFVIRFTSKRLDRNKRR